MLENNWCPYCQETTNQETLLAHKEVGDVYETTCRKCGHLLAWHLVSVGKEDKEQYNDILKRR